MVFNPTGGLVYHLRAQRYKKLWQPFCSQVAQWLESWQVGSTSLILVGPSGGYTLPTEFLKRFHVIHAVEPDPLAQLIFRLRHKVNVHWLNFDPFSVKTGAIENEQLKKLFDSDPQAAVLFSNVLGQLPLSLSAAHKSRGEAYMQSLAIQLGVRSSSREVASYHDVSSRDLKKPDVIYDHLTENLFPATWTKATSTWRITPWWEHTIEFAHN